MTRFVALLLTILLAALAATPSAALAQDNPFAPGNGQQQQAPSLPQGPPPPAPVDDSSNDGDGLTPAVGIAIGVVVLALIGGIWFAITRDARQAAPERRRVHTARTEPDAEARATPGSRGRHHTRSSGRRRKPSKQEQKRRKRGRAR